MNFPRPAHRLTRRISPRNSHEKSSYSAAVDQTLWRDPDRAPALHDGENNMASPQVTSWKDSSCIRWIRSFVPVGYKEEVISLSKLAGPVVSHPSVLRCPVKSPVTAGIIQMIL